jgi:hypothetical protein
VGFHWSRNIPVCVSASGSAIWDSGYSYSTHHWQSNHDSGVCWTSGFGVCYGKSQIEFLFILFLFFPFFLMLLLLLVSSFLPSDFLASFIGLAVLFSVVSSPFLVASPILIYNYCIYLHNLCLCIVYMPILLDNEF